MHPNLRKFIQQYEKEAKEKGFLRKKVGNCEVIFLDKIWGPLFNYNYEGLRVEYPFIDSKGGQRYADIYYENGLVCIIIEIDDFKTHLKHISYKKFDDHLERQNDLLENRWHLIRLTPYRITNHPENCKARIRRALGLCWTEAYGKHSTSMEELWQFRLSRCMEIAGRHGGLAKPTIIAAELNISASTAKRWLDRFTHEGFAQPVKRTKYICGYRFVDHSAEQTGLG